MNAVPAGYSDSEYSSEDEFMFSQDYDENGHRIRAVRPEPVVNRPEAVAHLLWASISEGNVVEFNKIWNENNDILDVNQPLEFYHWTPLMLVCQNRHMALVKYLLTVLKADPNANSNDMTALILACHGQIDLHGFTDDVSSEEETKVFQICELLLQHKAMVDKSNLKRQTPLMFAAKNGFVSCIQLLLNNRATLEACDNDERTALFYAVEDNRFDAVKALIEAGALIDTEDRFNMTPKRLAQDKGFEQIVALFPPDPIVECVPSNFRSYDTYMDYIPTAFPDKETPAYCPDIFTMLHGMRVADLEYKFYLAKISLPEFLTITDARLQEIGIEFPYQRKRILFGLLRFHSKAWSKSSLRFPQLKDDILQYFDVLTNCLKQLVVVKTSLHFITNHPIFAESQNCSDEVLELRQEIDHQLNSIQDKTLQLIQDMQKIMGVQEYPPPLFVCKSAIQERLKKTTFPMQFYKNIQIGWYVGLGIAGLTVAAIKSRFL